MGFNEIPGPDQAAERRSLRIISRAVALVGTIDLTSTDLACASGIEYFDDPGGGGGRLFIMASVVGRARVTDLNGSSRDANANLFRELNLRVKLGLITKQDLAAIT